MPDIWGQAAILTKFLLYIGAFGATGSVIARIAFAHLIASLDRKMCRQTIMFAALALVASLLGFMLRGAALTGGADGMVDPEMLGLLWQTPVGEALVFRVAGAALILAGMLMSYHGQGIALAGGLLLLFSFGQIGHITELEQIGAQILLLLHLVGVAFWIGVIAPLHDLSRRADQLKEAAQLGHQFGQAAMIIVPVLILAGLIMSWMLVGDLKALISTGYGQVLITKVALLAVVLLLAAANKLRFVPAMLAGDSNSARQLTRSLQFETAVILAVLVATATLTSVLSLPNGGS